jgi:hypothetical protein
MTLLLSHPRKSDFDPRLAHVGFVLDEVALWAVFSPSKLSAPPPHCLYPFTFLSRALDNLIS